MRIKGQADLTEEQKRIMITHTTNRLQDNIYLMLREHPFYSALLANFGIKTEIDDKIPVAAVTIQKGRPFRHTNPLGYMTYQQNEQIFIDIHEILHITDLHHLRGKGKDSGLWNICCDIEINQLIRSAIAVLPKNCLMYYHFNLPEGLSAEEYYEILDKREEPIKLPPELQNTLLDDLVNGNNDGDNNGNEPNGHKSQKAPGFENLHPHWEEAANDAPEVQKAVIQGMVRQAMVNSPGKVPGEMEAIIERLFEAQLNWPKLLSTFARSLLSSQRRNTWSRPSRKFGTVKMGSIRTKQLNLMVAIDTSYSTKQFLESFLAEIDGMKHFAKITIVQCDYGIQSVENFTTVNLDSFVIHGLGGTSFTPVFELATNKKSGDQFTLDEKPDGIVYLTDGEGTAPDYCGIPTLWVLTPNGSIPKTESGGLIDWGRFAYLDK
ncbi:vWA domain-containing protein [Priestia aryabhattai]